MEEFYPERIVAYCPRCGKKGFVPDPEQNAAKCGGCQFNLYFNPATSTAGILRNPAGQILLTVRAHDPCRGTLDLPGGFLSRFETAEECLVREVLEELNLKIEKLTYFTSTPNRYLFSGIVVFTIDLVYICDVASFDGVRAADDVAGFCLRYPHEIKLEEVGLESMKVALARYLGAIK